MSEDARIAALEQEVARLTYALDNEEIPARDRAREQLEELQEDVAEVESLLASARHSAREKSRSNQAIIEEHRSRIQSMEHFLSTIRQSAGNDVGVLQSELASMRETLFALRPRAADLADTLEAHARGAARRKKQASEIQKEVEALENEVKYLNTPVPCVLSHQNARTAPGPVDVPYAPKLLAMPTATLGGNGVAAEDRFGVLLKRVTAGGPLATAGVMVGDLIVSLGGRAISDEDVLCAEVSRYSAGDSVVVGVLRATMQGAGSRSRSAGSVGGGSAAGGDGHGARSVGGASADHINTVTNPAGRVGTSVHPELNSSMPRPQFHQPHAHMEVHHVSAMAQGHGHGHGGAEVEERPGEPPAHSHPHGHHHPPVHVHMPSHGHGHASADDLHGQMQGEGVEGGPGPAMYRDLMAAADAAAAESMAHGGVGMPHGHHPMHGAHGPMGGMPMGGSHGMVPGYMVGLGHGHVRGHEDPAASHAASSYAQGAESYPTPPMHGAYRGPPASTFSGSYTQSGGPAAVPQTA